MFDMFNATPEQVASYEAYLTRHGLVTSQVERARAMASAGDIYEMSECPDTYATCKRAACIHVILMEAAA